MNQLKSHFPALHEQSIAYLDSASSCQVPQTVTEAISQYLISGHGNPHRGMYQLSENANKILLSCRQAVAKLIHVDPQQIIFTPGTTEAINLVAANLEQKIDHNHSVLVTQLEHHANLLPWQRLCQRTGARLKLLQIDANGELDLKNFDKLLADNCAILAITQTSNLTGYSPPITQMIKQAKAYGVSTLIDGAQAIAHQSVNLQQLDCDFYAFSAHKLYGTSGTGILFSRTPDKLEPFVLGGGIVNRVTDESFELTSDISRFEAGSINMVGIVGLLSALEFLDQFDIDKIRANEKSLTFRFSQAIKNTDYQIISHPHSNNIVSITHDQFHSHDIASILASENVAVRAGHHCAQPYLAALGKNHCVRISFAMYNSESDVDQCLAALNKVPQILG